MGILVNRMENQNKVSGLFMLGISLCSASVISFEIVLTRIFSITLGYHFAYIIISIAMLGMALSGTLLSMFPRLKEKRILVLYALGLSLSMPLGCLALNLVPFEPVRIGWDFEQLIYICLYYIIISVPFLFFGLIMSATFAARSGESARVYGYDLIGAGLGSAWALLLLNFMGPGETVLIIAIFPLFGAYALGGRPATLLIALAMIAVFALFPNIINLKISPYKALHQAMLYPEAEHLSTHSRSFSRVDVFRSPLARFAPGLSLRYRSSLPEQIGITVDASSMSAVTSLKEGMPEFLGYLPSALPYEVVNGAKSAMIVDPKGGLSVLMARSYGVSDIHVVESDPLVVEVINTELARFSGNIYKQNTHKGLARTVLDGIDLKFDVIDISLLSPVLSGELGISEDYSLTVESFTSYLNHLDSGGLVAVSGYILPPYRAELRLLNTAVMALKGIGIENPESNVAAIRSWDVICMLIKPSPFSAGEIERLKRFAERNHFDLVYYKGIVEAEMDRHIKTPALELNRSIGNIMGHGTRQTFVSNYPFNISATTDDSPFFHYYLRLQKLGEAYELVGRKWQFFVQGGYVLPAVLMLAALLSIALLILPLLRKGSREASPKATLIYFALLGIGFMFIEVPLIQKLILFFQHPPIAMTVVLASLLISSGAGSMLSSKIAFLRQPRTLLIIAALVILYSLLLSRISESMLISLPVVLRALICFVLIFPLGALLGIPFPLGISLLGKLNKELIPWAWAVNGCFSVMAPLTAAIIAINTGYTPVFILGAAMYVLSYLVLVRGQLSKLRSPG